MAIPTWLEAASAAGQAIGGIATVAGVAFAVWSVNNWKREGRGAARARAAAELLPPALAFCDETWIWASHLLTAALDAERFAREKGYQPAIHALRSVAPREERLRMCEKELRVATVRAVPYLTKPELQAIAAAGEVRRSIDRFWFRYETRFIASFIAGRDARLPTDAVVAEFEPDRVALEGLKERIELVLSHIARHEEPPDLRPLAMTPSLDASGSESEPVIDTKSAP